MIHSGHTYPAEWAPRRLVRAMTLASILLLGISGCGNANFPVVSDSGPGDVQTGASNRPEVQEVTIAVVSTSDFLPYYVGEKHGIFEKRGLNVKVQTLAPPTMPAAMVNGSIQGMGLLQRCENAGRQKLPLTFVSNFGTKHTYQLIATSGISSLNDLAGKRLIASAASAAPTVQVEGILDRADLLEKVEIINIAAVESQVAAFRSGQAPAIFLQVADAVKVMKTVPGAHVLVDIDEAGTSIPLTGLCVTEQFLQKHPATVYQLIAGLAESVGFINQNEEKTLDVLMQSIKLTRDEAKIVYDTSKDLFTESPIPTKAMLEQLAKADSQSEKKTVAVEDVLAVTDFTIAERVAKDLKLPE
jgi:NitT/TauT family transport system substrate-binding protein